MRLPLLSLQKDWVNRLSPADDVASRIPLPAYPAGWYGIAFSHEINPGEVKRVQFTGRELVAFRTPSGRAAIFDAYCPHMGAHFGHGGCVVGETLRCPMHNFLFSADGACVSAGGRDAKPPSVKAGVVHVRESCGVLLAWHHPEGAPPSWEPPPLADPSLAAGPSQRRQITVRSHVQELAENVFDAAHFIAVHGYEEPDVHPRPTCEGHVIHGKTRLFHPTGVVGPSKRVQVDLAISVYGLGIILFDSVSEPGGLAFRGAFTPAPIAPGVVEFRINLWIKKIDEGLAAAPGFRWLPERVQNELMGRILAFTMMRDVRQDQAVLEHKKYLARPGMVEGDAATSVFRRWAGQFYPDVRLAG